MMCHRHVLDCALSICHEQCFGRFKASMEGILKGPRTWGHLHPSPVSRNLDHPSPKPRRRGLSLPPKTHSRCVSFLPHGGLSLILVPHLWWQKGTEALESDMSRFKSRLPLVLTVWSGSSLSHLSFKSVKGNNGNYIKDLVQFLAKWDVNSPPWLLLGPFSMASPCPL